jgi:hypothetical protein
MSVFQHFLLQDLQLLELQPPTQHPISIIIITLHMHSRIM